MARGSGSRWYSKRSLSSLARDGLIGAKQQHDEGLDMEKRHIGAFARLAASGFHGPKRTLASLMSQKDALSEQRSGYKRGLPSIARQGGYGQWHDAEKRPLSSIARQGGFGNYDRRSLASLVRQGGMMRNQDSEITPNEDKRSLSSLARQGDIFGWDGPDKRGLSSIARQGGYGMVYQNKRNLGSLASQGLYSNNKRNLASIARFGGMDMDDDESIAPGYRQIVIDDGFGKRSLSSIARQGGFLRDDSEVKRGLSSIARQGGFLRDDSEAKRSLSSIARQGGSLRDDSEVKRGLSSIARQGGFLRDDSEAKRSLSSIVRQGAFRSPGQKRNLASVVRQGGFDDGVTVVPRPTRFPQYLDDLDDFSDELEAPAWFRLPPSDRWEHDASRQKRYMAALARLAPRPLSSGSFWTDPELADRPRSSRSSGQPPSAAGSEASHPEVPPSVGASPDAAEGASSRQGTKSSEESHGRRKRSLEREVFVDAEEPTWDYDGEGPARRVPSEVISTGEAQQNTNRIIARFTKLH